MYSGPDWHTQFLNYTDDVQMMYILMYWKVPNVLIKAVQARLPGSILTA